MDNQRKSLLITIAVALLIIALIIGLIYYLIRFIQSRRTATTTVSNSIQRTALPSGSPSSQIQPGSTQGGVSTGNDLTNVKFHNSPAGFQIRSPKNWGLLTCANSNSIELDPQNQTDQRGISCDTALKPVTVLVGDTRGCGGETISLGAIQVQKQRFQEGNYIKYQWCTRTSPTLNITHRVSGSNDPATSKQDYSSQVEDMIKGLTFVRGS